MTKDILIIGGGASGLVTAIIAKRKDNTKTVCILERKERILKKVLATGNGRCNFTNENLNVDNYYGNNRDFVKYGLEQFGYNEVIEFFSSLGIMSTVENRGKVYPISLQASSIVDSLRFEAEKLGIEIINDFDVNKIKRTNEGFAVDSVDNKCIVGKKLVLATGGKSTPELGSNGSGYELAKKLGHSVTELQPALVQLKTEKDEIRGLEGIKVNADVTAYAGKNKVGFKSGELLFTNYGVSGTVIFDLSYLACFHNNLKLSVDFFPSFDEAELLEIIIRRRKLLSHLTVENFLNGILNKKLGQLICKKSGVQKLSVSVKEIYDTNVRNIVKLLKTYEIRVKDTTGFKNAQVTAGGVYVDEINNKTMESKLVKDLYIIGETLDIFGDCGGYNLHWAWCSGYLAGLDL